MAVRRPAQRRLEELFAWYAAHPEHLPPGYRDRATDHGLARSVGDYIAGMTDRFLERDHDARCGRG
jgi:dGTPase